MNKPMSVGAAILAAALLVPVVVTTASATPDPRLSSIEPDESLQEEYQDDVAQIIGGTYGGRVAETTVTSTDGSDEKITPARETPEEVVDSIADQVDVSAEARSDISDLVEQVDVEHADLDIPSLPDLKTVAVAVEPMEVTATHVSKTGDIVAEVRTMVKETYDSGVTSESALETIVSVDPESGVMTSFWSLTEEDYADAAERDSSVAPADESGPSSAEDVPLDVFGTGSTPEETAADRAAPSGLKAGMSAANKKKAVAYAVKYAIQYNGAYRKWSGTDCTNFVSQAMQAGGWGFARGISTSDKYWWYNRTYQTRSWAGAANWFRFARNHSKRAAVTGFKSLVPGDVIQVKFRGDSNIHHSMIVTRKDALGVYISSHSTDRRHFPLSEFMKRTPGATYYAHRI